MWGRTRFKRTSDAQWLWERSREVEHLGWRVRQIDERPLGRVRRLVDGHTHVLILASDPIPAGWPEEMRGRRDDHPEWRFQDHLGQWQEFSCQGSDSAQIGECVEKLFGDQGGRKFQRWAERMVTSTIGWIYSRSPVATEHTLVRPIVYLRVARDGTCFDVTAPLTDIILLKALRLLGHWSPEAGCPSWMHPEIFRCNMKDLDGE